MGRGRSGAGRNGRVVSASKVAFDDSVEEEMAVMVDVEYLDVKVDDDGYRDITLDFRKGLSAERRSYINNYVIQYADRYVKSFQGAEADRRQVAVLGEIERLRQLGAYERGVGDMAVPGRARRRSTHEAAATREGISLTGNELLPQNSRPRLVLVEGDKWELRKGGKGSTVYATGRPNGLRRYAKDMGAPVGLIMQFTGNDKKPVANPFRGEKQTPSMTRDGVNPWYEGGNL